MRLTRSCSSGVIPRFVRLKESKGDMKVPKIQSKTIRIISFFYLWTMISSQEQKDDFHSMIDPLGKELISNSNSIKSACNGFSDI